jgi:GT2 family glycosyltransferase
VHGARSAGAARPAITNPRSDRNVQAPSARRVLAVLVAHDGARWLPAALDTLAAQTFEGVDVVAVDNGSTDGSRELLVRRLGPHRVLVADRDLGFPAAVSMALDAASDEVELLWLLHDDAAFASDALARLVAALDVDPRLAAVGPKLVEWADGDVLQSVGMTIDLTGRADTGLDPGERDQGQRDQSGPALYVSTAGMLVRREAIEAVGRFDRRFHVFRDDLDLCWRLWIAGHEVGVEPTAVGAHVGAAANYVRLGQTRQLGPRYFAERNTLAALLKNYGPARLPLVVALYMVVGVAKVVGFVLTRRVGDAWQTLRAWGWNLLHLRETWRLRRAVQALRVRTDAELRERFGRITPRLRAYAEAIGDWIAGGERTVDDESFETEPAASDEPVPTPSARRRGTFALLARRPVAVAGIVLALVVVVGAWPLMIPGELRGGELAPWPDSPSAFFGDYLAGWHEAAAFGTSQAPSPVQAVLGLLHVLAGGSAYLAPRLLLFGPVVLAWLFALRAAQATSSRRIPRVVAATAYVLSPPALAALATGRIGGLVLLAVLPGLVAAGVVFADRSASAASAWRAVSGAVLLASVGAAFEPILLPAVAVAGVVLLLTAFGRGADRAWQRALIVRTTAVVVVPAALLLPWSVQLLDVADHAWTRRGVTAGGELWRWLALAPELAGFPGLLAGAGFVVAGLLGLVLSGRGAPVAVGSLWVVALLGATGAWLLGRAGEVVWPGSALLLVAGAFAGLFALAFATAGDQLSRYGFGWRQVSAAVAVLAVVASVGASVVAFARDPLDAYAVGDPPLPAFVTSAATVDRFRVLVLADTPDGVAWEVVPGSGPSMAATGVPPSAALDLVDRAVGDAVGRRDATASSRLGPLNVRYVFVPEGGVSDELDAALRGQLDLEPRPVATGRLYRVAGALPRAAVVSAATSFEIETRGSLMDEPVVEEIPALLPGRYAGTIEEIGGPVLVAEPDDGQWEAFVDGRRLDLLEPHAAGTVRFSPVEAGGEVEVRHTGGAARNLEVTGQVLAVLLVISLALRPPRFARRPSRADESVPERPSLADGGGV